MKSLLTTTTEIDYIRGDRVTCGVTNAVRVEMKKKNNKKQSDHALYIYRHSSQAYVTIQVGTLLVAIILIG
jgi:hypothetical protein